MPDIAAAPDDEKVFVSNPAEKVAAPDENVFVDNPEEKVPAAPLTFIPPLNVAAPPTVIVPITSKVLDNVAAPDDENVFVDNPAEKVPTLENVFCPDIV